MKTNRFSRPLILTLIVAASAQLLTLPAYAAPSPGTMGAGAFGELVLVVLGSLALAGLAMVWRGLFPKRVEWTGEIVRRMPWQSFFFGLIIGLAILIAIALVARGGGRIGGLIALILLIVALFLFGGSAVASIVEWIGEMIDPAATGIRRAILGGSAWMVMICIPILGWATMIALFLTGIGAALMGYVPPQTAPAPQPPVPMPPQPPA